jgi:MYXO-CTERM domain-containing protein
LVRTVTEDLARVPMRAALAALAALGMVRRRRTTKGGI